MTAGDSVPTPPSIPPIPPDRNLSRLVGSILLILAATLALVLASSPVRGPDVWANLVAGRAWFHGTAPDASDLVAPMRPATGHVLYEVPLYVVHRLVGDEGLAAANAAIAGIVAILVVWAARSGWPTVRGGVAALLVGLAVAPWLELTPVLPSCVLFVACLGVLRRAAENAQTGPARLWPSWAFYLGLIAIWANVDGSVVLGPVAALLGVAGEWLRGRAKASAALTRLVPVGLVASLLSPNHVRPWITIPFSQSNGIVEHGTFAEWLRDVPVAVPLAHAALTILVMWTLMRERRGPAWTWAVLWVALLALGCCQPRAIPFCGLTAGVLTASSTTSSRITRRVRMSQWATVLVGLSLIVVAWPGWLLGRYGRPTWSIEAVSSLRDARGTIARNASKKGHGLTLSPAVANAWMWYTPDDTLHAQRAVPLDVPEARMVRDGLLGASDLNDWREVLRSHDVGFVVAYAGAPPPADPLVHNLARSPEWELLDIRGPVAVFMWRDANRDRVPVPHDQTLDHRAYHPEPADRAPVDRPDRLAGEREWWEAFTEPPHEIPPEQDEVGLLLAYFDGQRGRSSGLATIRWLAAQASALVADFSASPLPGTLPMRIMGAPGGWESYAAGWDDGPRAALLVAVRTARRAIARNPDDGRGYILLGEAYLRLSEATRERVWRAQLPAFDRVRFIQAVAAYQQALALRPDSLAAHGRLARIYRDRGALDLAARHLDGLLRASRSRGPQPGVDPAAFREEIRTLEREKSDLDAEVRRREAELDAGRQGRVVDKARAAVTAGLPARALRTLLKSDASEFGSDGAKMELDLLLWEGRVRDVRAWAEPALEATVGAQAFYEIQAGLAAATGDYSVADQALRRVAGALRADPSSPTALPPTALGSNPLARFAVTAQMSLVQGERVVAARSREANAHVVRGILALESGQTEDAADAMREALRTWQEARDPFAREALDFSGRQAAESCLHQLSTP